MNEGFAADLVRRYYAAYRSDRVREALTAVLAQSFALDSPLVRDRVGGPASGEAAFTIAERFASALRRVEVEALYFTRDDSGVVALIRIPVQEAPVWQSEHFHIDVDAGLITSLRSFYDPRLLIEPRRSDESSI
jgi:ketosteroid isomerase-like protein